MKRLIIQYTSNGLRTVLEGNDRECYATFERLTRALREGERVVEVGGCCINLRNVAYVDVEDVEPETQKPSKEIGTWKSLIP
ncbi:MAG: hypothetical protein CW346_14490 [Bacillaceae bacterium]|nr:hypothetical protein [Bacillaceae bacterium]